MSKKNGKFPHLFEIPEHVLFKVVAKLPSKERITFRKTCRFAGNFVEDKRKLLSKTCLQGGTDIVISGENGKLYFKQIDQRLSRPYIPVTEDFEKRLSGLAIKLLMMIDDAPYPFELFDSFLKRFKFFVVSTYFMMNLTIQELSALSESVDVLTDCGIVFTKGYLLENLEIVKQSRNASKLHIEAYNHVIPRETDPSIAEIMKFFRSFRLMIYDSNPSFFHHFILGIYHERECNLVSCVFDLVQKTAPKFESDRYPPMSVIWDLNSFEYKLQAPEAIRILTTEDRWIVIYDVEHSFKLTMHTRFFKKTDETGLLEFVLKILNLKGFISDEKKCEYIRSNGEERFEMLRKAYWERCRAGCANIPESLEEFIPYVVYLKRNGLSDTRNI